MQEVNTFGFFYT